MLGCLDGCVDGASLGEILGAVVGTLDTEGASDSVGEAEVICSDGAALQKKV